MYLKVVVSTGYPPPALFLALCGLSGSPVLLTLQAEKLKYLDKPKGVARNKNGENNNNSTPGESKECQVDGKESRGEGEVRQAEVCCNCCCHVNGFIIQTKRLKM